MLRNPLSDRAVIGSLKATDLPASLHRKLSVKEVGAARGGIHVKCQVCGHLIPIDDKTSRARILRISHHKIERRSGDIIQTFLTNSWGWATYKRRVGTYDPIRSKAVPKVFITGAGRFLRSIYKRALRTVKGPWFAVAMHGQPGVGEQLFVCRLDGLAEAIGAICKEAPDLRRQLMAKLSGSSVDPVNLEAAGKPKDNAELVIDESTAVPI